MSDRPAAANGKRNQAWGTLQVCPECGQCLCFGCHPTGPCVDEQALVDLRALPGNRAPFHLMPVPGSPVEAFRLARQS